MTVESMAAFYGQTDAGKYLIQQGRREGIEAGSERVLGLLLHARFGADPRIAGIAHRLAQQPGEEAVLAVEKASSVDDLDDPPGLPAS